MHFLMRSPLAAPKFLTALALVGLVGLPQVAHAQNIDTVAPWNGSNQVSPWGAGAEMTSTYGQSITAPGGISRLDTFSFRVAGNGAALINTNYVAHVYGWNSTTRLITSSALWSSGTLSTGTINNGVFTALSFSPGITITPGTEYMLFLTTAGVSQAGNSGAGRWGFSGTTIGGLDNYSGGGFFFNNTSSFASLSSTPWSSPQTFGFGVAGADLAFTATFSSASAAPEPGTLALLTLGIAGELIARRRK